MMCAMASAMTAMAEAMEDPLETSVVPEVPPATMFAQALNIKTTNILFVYLIPSNSPPSFRSFQKSPDKTTTIEPRCPPSTPPVRRSFDGTISPTLPKP